MRSANRNRTCEPGGNGLIDARRAGARLLAACWTAIAAVCVAWGLPTPARAAAPVPCTSIGGGKYECDWWRAGDGISGGAIVVNGGRVVGYLHRGRNWILCQARGAKVTNSASNRNDWYGWTVADNGAKGWASPLDARGGEDYGQFASVPICDGSQGPTPPVSGTWETAPPGGAPPPPSPQPLGGTTPQQAAPSTRLIYRAGLAVSITGHGFCTSAFPLRIGRRIVGLTAGHCAERSGSVNVRTSVGVTPLGRVVKNILHGPYLTDAVVFGAGGTPGTPRWAQQIARRGMPPLEVAGIVKTSDQRIGMRVCFTGRASGSDRCGSISTGVEQHHYKSVGTMVNVVCASGFLAGGGDSGGPVYTNPIAGRVRAVGIIASTSSSQTCYTPIEEILKAVGGRIA